MYKTHTCGELRAGHAGQTVTLAGWVHRWRNFGGVVFLTLRDRFGIVQITINPDLPKETLELVKDVRFEWVLQVKGIVQKRPAGQENPKMETGEIEVTTIPEVGSFTSSTCLYQPVSQVQHAGQVSG